MQLEGLKVETWASCFLLKHFFLVCSLKLQSVTFGALAAIKQNCVRLAELLLSVYVCDESRRFWAALIKGVQ